MNHQYFLEHLIDSSFNILTDNTTFRSFELKTRVLDLKEKLVSLKKESYVGIYLSFDVDYFLTIFALWDLGITPVLLTTKSPLTEIKSLANQVPYNFVITKGFTILKVSKHAIKKTDQSEALVFFTSGSTEKPKGVIHTFESLFYSAKGSIEFYHYNYHDRFLLTLPPNHVGGFMIFLRALLSKGTFIISQDNVLTHSPTTLSFVPTQMLDLIKLKTDFSKLKVILIGGAPIPTELLDICDKRNIPISPTYGSTEAGAQVSAIVPGTQIEAGFLGTPLPYRDIKLSLDGEILIKGKNLFKGYFKNLLQISPRIDDGYFITNDLGKVINDKIYIIGRNDLAFISGGENINPVEIENALLSHPDIKEVYVVPVSHERYGEVPFCFIKGEKNNYQNWLKEYLPSFKIPKFYHYLTGTDLKQSRSHLMKMATKIRNAK